MQAFVCMYKLRRIKGKFPFPCLKLGRGGPSGLDKLFFSPDDGQRASFFIFLASCATGLCRAED